MENTEPRCKSCGTGSLTRGGLTICSDCEETLLREMRSVSTLALVTLSIALIFAVTALIFVVFAIAKSGQTGSFVMGGRNPTVWTVNGLFVTSAVFFVIGLPIFYAWIAVKKMLRKKEAQFESLSGDVPAYSLKDTN